MKCEEFLRLLDADEGWDLGEAAGHAISCPSCGEAVRRMAQAATAFQAMREDEAPPFLHTRVMAHVREEAAKAPWWKALLSPRAAWAGPLVAVAVVVVLGGYGLKQGLWSGRAPTLQADRPLPGATVSDERSKGKEESAQVPSAPQPVASAEKSPSEPAKVPGRRDEASDQGGAFAPEFKADLPPAAASQIPEAEKKSLRYASTPAEPVEPLSPPFLGAGAEPAGDAAAMERTAPAERAPAAPAPYAAPGATGSLELLKQADKDAAAAARAQRERDQKAIYAYGEISPDEMMLCTLRSGGGKLLLVQIPAAVAPPAGATWGVAVRSGGVLEVRDASGKAQTETAEALRAALDTLELAPGSYTLAGKP